VISTINLLRIPEALFFIDPASFFAGERHVFTEAMGEES
jgi:hypothetical protein